MLKEKLELSTALLFVFGFTGLQAQTTIPASGGNATGGGGTASYSVGQIVYTTNTNSNGSVAQGVQQPYEISIVTGIKEALGISLEVSVYPNPAQNFITLNIKNYEVENLRYELYDINGSLIKENKVEGNEIQILIHNLKPSVYFLKVTENNKVIKTFKIVKS